MLALVPSERGNVTLVLPGGCNAQHLPCNEYVSIDLLSCDGRRFKTVLDAPVFRYDTYCRRVVDKLLQLRRDKLL
jgi:hypothetical protein